MDTVGGRLHIDEIITAILSDRTTAKAAGQL